MAIANRELVKGTRLVAKYKKQSYECMVLDNGEGRLIFRLGDGREFNSLSAAGVAITGSACNGWIFWAEADGTKPVAAKKNAEPEVTRQEAPKDEGLTVTRIDKGATTAKADSKCVINRVANQNAVPKGLTLWRCYTCKVSFRAPTGEKPTTHPAS